MEPHSLIVDVVTSHLFEGSPHLPHQLSGMKIGPPSWELAKTAGGGEPVTEVYSTSKYLRDSQAHARGAFSWPRYSFWPAFSLWDWNVSYTGSDLKITPRN